VPGIGIIIIASLCSCSFAGGAISQGLQYATSLDPVAGVMGGRLAWSMPSPT
jgi:hypothetical protein